MRAPRLSIGLGSFLVALALVVAVGIGSAIAVIPNQGTYYACLTKKTGAVKVINYPKVKCAKGTQLIKWNAKGPAGPQGPAGPADWNAIPNKPAGFADGSDDAGVTGVKVTNVKSTITLSGPQLTGGNTSFHYVTCPAGTRVVGGGYWYENALLRTYISAADPFPAAGSNLWWVSWYVVSTIPSNEAPNVTVYASCLSTQPGGALTVASKTVKPAKFTPKQRKEIRRLGG